jgi:biopolymer transport protein ExbB/TolQ
MYFRVACPHCEKNLKVREEHVGRRLGCPYCKSSLVVPAPPSAPEQPAADESERFPGISTTETRPSPTKKPPSRRPSEGPAPTERTGWSSGTEVNTLLTGLIGLGIAVVFYILMLPLRDYAVPQLFLDRGWVPYVLVFLMGWSLAILLLKWQKLQRQRASMLFDLIPTDLADEITLGNRQNFVDHVNSLPVDHGESFLCDRVRRGLEHFGVRKSSPEVGTILASQSEIDATAVESSYTLLKVFIWAIPILGFIGTVIGISAAVGGFSGSLEQAEDLSVLKQSLNGVTSGLATAFDTTLIALVMSLLVMFPTSALQKMEEDVLNWVDEYCNENLLKRLNDGREGGAERGTGGISPSLQRAIESSLAGHHAELRVWTKRLEAIGETLTRQVVDGWSDLTRQVQDDDRERLERLMSMEQHVSNAIAQSANNMQQYTTDLQQGLTALSGVLEDLGKQQVIVQQVPAKRRKRGWFFRRHNGEP